MNVTFTCTSRLRSYELYVLLVIFRISICLFKYIVTKLLTKKTNRLQATTFECKTKIISGKYCICVFFRRIFSVIIEIRSQSLLISAVNFFAWYKHIISSSLYDFLSLQHFQLIFDKWKFISPNVALNCAFTLWTPHDKITLKFNLILNWKNGRKKNLHCSCANMFTSAPIIPSLRLRSFHQNHKLKFMDCYFYYCIFKRKVNSNI